MSSAYEQDIILLEQLKSGSPAAFSRLYVQQRRYLQVVALSLLDNEMEAQDVVQEFFIDFWEKRLFLKINPAGKTAPFIRNYIYRIIYNRCMDKLDQRYNKLRKISRMPAPENTAPADLRIENQEWQNELGIALEAAIREVPPLSAKVFELSYLRHKSRNEIAAELGISPHTVKNQLARAIKILRSRLRKLSF